MNKNQGYTLIELTIFIVILAIIGSTILLALNAVLTHEPKVQQQGIAAQSATKCAEWFLGQRRVNGFNAITCPSNTVPTFCNAPAGYIINTAVSCTTINGDPNYKTINIAVSGLGNATLSLLIANY